MIPSVLNPKKAFKFLRKWRIMIVCEKRNFQTQVLSNPVLLLSLSHGYDSLFSWYLAVWFPSVIKCLKQSQRIFPPWFLLHWVFSFSEACTAPLDFCCLHWPTSPLCFPHHPLHVCRWRITNSTPPTQVRCTPTLSAARRGRTPPRAGRSNMTRRSSTASSTSCTSTWKVRFCPRHPTAPSQGWRWAPQPYYYPLFQ